MLSRPRGALGAARGLLRRRARAALSERMRRTISGVALAAGLGAYGLFLFQNSAHAVGGSDSSGYANQAKRLLDGRLVDRPRGLGDSDLPDSIADVFIPLGFLEGPRPGTMVPLYPVGFPAHLAAAAAMAGWERGPFLVSPLAGVGCICLLYVLGRRMSLGAADAAAVAALFALWPPMVFQSLQPMSDVVATFWTLAAVLAALRARDHASWALLSGAAFGLSVLVRPTNALLLLPIALALPMRRVPFLLFIAGGTPMALALAEVGRLCYGGFWHTGWERTGHLSAMALSNFSVRLGYYAGWILRTLTPVVPLAAAAFAFVRSEPWRRRVLLLAWFATPLVFYSFYGPYESFGFLRFLLPGIPALLLAAALAVRSLRSFLGERPGTAAALVLAAGVALVEIRATRRIGVLPVVAGQSIYPQTARWAAETLPSADLVVACFASGALEYYTDRTYVRWDRLTPERWKVLRATFESKGRSFFALLFPEEEKEWRRNVPGRWKKVGQMHEVGLWQLLR